MTLEKTRRYLTLTSILCALTGSAIFVQSCARKTAPAAAAAATFELKGSTSKTAAAASLMRQIWNLLDTQSAFGGASFSGVLHGIPSNVRVKMYAVYLSLNADCTSPVLVQDYGVAGAVKNLTGGETLFSGNPPDGTYKCMIMKLSDQIKFNVTQSDVTWWQTNHAGSACNNAATDYVFDGYRDDGSVSTPSVDLDGVAIAPRGTNAAPVDDVMFMFVTTAPTTAKANGVDVNATGQTIEMTLAAGVTGVVVPGTGTFYYDFSAPSTGGTLSGDPASTDVCKIDGPFEWGYR